MLFWGNEQVLWLAVASVLIISLLLIRVGIAHFQREYLLGREIDNLNVRWMWRMFWANFTGDARSLGAWYRGVLGATMRRILPALLYMVLIAAATSWLSYGWIMQNVSETVALASPEDLTNLEKRVREIPELENIREHISAPFLFMNNTRAVAIIFLAGLVSFSVLGILIYMLNIGLIGGVFAMLELLGLQPAPLFLAGVAPHGVFELPALMIGSAAALYFGAAIVTPQTGKSMGEVLLELLADWARIFIGLVVPLLVIAAVIEAYITPAILLGVLSR